MWKSHCKQNQAGVGMTFQNSKSSDKLAFLGGFVCFPACHVRSARTAPLFQDLGWAPLHSPVFVSGFGKPAYECLSLGNAVFLAGDGHTHLDMYACPDGSEHGGSWCDVPSGRWSRQRGARRSISCSDVLIRNFSGVAAAICWHDGAAIRGKKHI